MDSKDLEKYTSAITLSDMEVFVFPELMYALVLANIMSPLIWRWREEDTFKKLQGKSPWRRLMRMRQYIMDEYDFNLDLNTWGLTTKDVELARFEPWISKDDLARSNALFGYQGDQYYFDVGIRRHFGLDQYDGDIIPYWKTETVEAMNAFRFREGYTIGAGECVSLSTLYAAGAFIVCEIPLDDIFMVLTPLHSQNFIDIQDGVITNNRRLVTKSMWFNGTEISNKAQRAIRNEKVTIVAHNTGYVHVLYDRATIDPAHYGRFREKLLGYLRTELNALNFANFLRSCRDCQSYFQFCRRRRGENMFVKAEVLYGYEHGSRFRVYDETFDKLLDEVAGEDYNPCRIAHRMCVEQFMQFIEYEKIDIENADDRAKLARFLAAFLPDADAFVRRLYEFLHIDPMLPSGDKRFEAAEPIRLDPGWSREQIIDYLESIRDRSLTADLAFYAWRNMTRCRWRPFVKAAVERCPVSLEKTKDQSIDDVYHWLQVLPNISIYDGPRLAQPDEVANFLRGDGIEKGFLLANVIRRRHPDRELNMDIARGRVTLTADDGEYVFATDKPLEKSIAFTPEDLRIEGEP